MALSQGTRRAESGEWAPQRQGPHWNATVNREAGGERLRWSFPRGTDVSPPAWAAFQRRLPVPAAAAVDLCFQWTDSFRGPTAGHHFLRVAIDGRTVWEADVAGGRSGTAFVRIDVTAACGGHAEVSVRVLAETRKRVTNFPVVIQAKGIRLIPHQEAAAPAAPAAYRPPPPDLPLPAAPRGGAEWTGKATILQPWGQTQFTAMRECGDLPQRLARDYGFNTLIVLPPEAHAFTAPPECRLTDAEFRAAISAYRAAGFRILLYSSVMHIGHSRAWEEGMIERDHPRWAQRSAEGGAIRTYGHPWLCPSTGALDYAVEYTLDIVRAYDADGVMLDNNQFMEAPDGSGPTCYCDACQDAFRSYVSARFGNACAASFGEPADDLDIPHFPGPLMNLWIHFRNRIWARANERFRKALATVRPGLIFFANTQYGRAGWDLATDLQYLHEDVMLSESRGLDSLAMSAKLTLGTALAHGRPLWNYIGTFRENDFRRLRPAREVASITAPALAQQAPPWIVYYGFDEANAADAPARKALRNLLDLRRDHPDLCVGGQPWAPLGVLFDTRSRNYTTAPLLPACLKPLLTSGIPLVGIQAQNLTDTDLTDLRLLVAPNIACLTTAESTKLSAWMGAGGILVATADLATRDELGLLRPEPGLSPANTAATQITLVEPGDLAAAVIQTNVARFAVNGIPLDTRLEFRAYTTPGGVKVVHVVNHDSALATEWTLTLPCGFAAGAMAAEVLRPGHDTAARLRLTRAGDQIRVAMPAIDVYAIIRLRE